MKLFNFQTSQAREWKEEEEGKCENGRALMLCDWRTLPLDILHLQKMKLRREKSYASRRRTVLHLNTIIIITHYYSLVVSHVTRRKGFESKEKVNEINVKWSKSENVYLRRLTWFRCGSRVELVKKKFKPCLTPQFAFASSCLSSFCRETFCGNLKWLPCFAGWNSFWSQVCRTCGHIWDCLLGNRSTMHSKDGLKVQMVSLSRDNKAWLIKI